MRATAEYKGVRDAEANSTPVTWDCHCNHDYYVLTDIISLIIVIMPSPPSQRFPFPCRTGRLWWRAGGGGEGGERRADVCCWILTILQLLALVTLQLYEGAGHQAPSCWEPTYLTLKAKKLSDNQADSKSASNHFANILWLRKKPWERRKCGVDPITGDCVR